LQAIENLLKINPFTHPLKRLQQLNELLKQITPAGAIAPHKEIHPYCNAIHDDFIYAHAPRPASPGQRVCARDGCGSAAYICPHDVSKFGSYCSSSCYWLEVATLNETRITSLDQNDMDFHRISVRFQSEIPTARIVQIFRLQMPRRFAERYKTYRLCMASASNTAMASITHRMFHGTQARCSLLGMCLRAACPGPAVSGCGKADCAVCGIARTGNQMRFSKRGGRE
jgi:hypothetical protein